MANNAHTVLLSTVLLVAGCVESGARPETATDAGDADVQPEAGREEADGGTCEKMGETCGPPEHCCRDVDHVIGMRVDLDRNCYAAERTLLACRTRTPLGGCGADLAHDCWTRPLPDGGREVFFTPSYWQDGMVPGFTRCDDALGRTVTSRAQPCP